jgi:hypothetical protein
MPFKPGFYVALGFLDAVGEILETGGVGHLPGPAKPLLARLIFPLTFWGFTVVRRKFSTGELLGSGTNYRWPPVYVYLQYRSSSSRSFRYPWSES